MPRQSEFTSTIQFTSAASHRVLIERARTLTGHPTAPSYLRHVLCEALSRDLGIPLEQLLAELPAAGGNHYNGKTTVAK